MGITSAKYLKPVNDDNTIIKGSNNISIIAVIDGVTSTIPLAEGNRHYKEIMEQVKAGTLTIKDAD
tara:strand:- start:131 stop:328 length:198 start_codon:yes stop_codon:yes gene_type:complete